MTPQRAKELLPIIEAYSNGQEIQAKPKGANNNWYNLSSNNIFFSDPELDYRIKPKLKPRDFWLVSQYKFTSKESAEEFIKEEPHRNNFIIIHVREVLDE